MLKHTKKRLKTNGKSGAFTPKMFGSVLAKYPVTIRRRNKFPNCQVKWIVFSIQVFFVFIFFFQGNVFESLPNGNPERKLSPYKPSKHQDVTCECDSLWQTLSRVGWQTDYIHEMC